MGKKARDLETLKNWIVSALDTYEGDKNMPYTFSSDTYHGGINYLREIKNLKGDNNPRYKYLKLELKLIYATALRVECEQKLESFFSDTMRCVVCKQDLGEHSTRQYCDKYDCSYFQ